MPATMRHPTFRTTDRAKARMAAVQLLVSRKEAGQTLPRREIDRWIMDRFPFLSDKDQVLLGSELILDRRGLIAE
jgi:hypothetical protein